jgi:dimethylargininase
MFSSLGYEPVIVDISGFPKLGGSVTCLSVRLRDLAR